MDKKRGFTLIELMVVIAIIAILAAVGITAYSKTQLASRDSRRKNDLREIAQALALYYQTNRRYPITPSSGSNEVSTSTSPWLEDNGTDGNGTGKAQFYGPYMTREPLDPTNSGSYYYIYLSPPSNWGSCKPGQYYILVGFLENTGDKDTNTNQNYTQCGVSYGSGGLNLPGNAFAILPP